MKTIYSRCHWADRAAEARDEITKGREVLMVSEHDTFYGAGFEVWLREELGDVADTEIVEWDTREQMPRSVLLRPKKAV